MRPTIKIAFTAIVASSIDDGLCRLGHSNIQKLFSLVKNKKILVSNSALNPYSSCRLGKLSRVSLAAVEHISSELFDIIFFDV